MITVDAGLEPERAGAVAVCRWWPEISNYSLQSVIARHEKIEALVPGVVIILTPHLSAGCDIFWGVTEPEPGLSWSGNIGCVLIQ